MDPTKADYMYSLVTARSITRYGICLPCEHLVTVSATRWTDFPTGWLLLLMMCCTKRLGCSALNVIVGILVGDHLLDFHLTDGTDGWCIDGRVCKI